MAFSLNQGLVGVSATHASPASRMNTGPTDISGPSVRLTNYVSDPDGAGPLTAMADPITWTVQDVPYAAFVSNGASGDTMAFSPSSAGSGFILGVTGHQHFTFLNATGFGAVNAGTPTAVPGSDTCTDFPPATGAFATALADQFSPSHTTTADRSICRSSRALIERVHRIGSPGAVVPKPTPVVVGVSRA